jgi:hypothetical protein
MYYKDKLKDWGVRNEGIIKVLGKHHTSFTITIKLMEVKTSIAEFKADHSIYVKDIKLIISEEFIELDPNSFQLFLGGDEM